MYKLNTRQFVQIEINIATSINEKNKLKKTVCVHTMYVLTLQIVLNPVMFEKFNNFLMKQQYGANDVDLTQRVFNW